MGQSRPLSPEELGQLTKRMVNSEDRAEADRLKEEIVRGFYGSQSAVIFFCRPLWTLDLGLWPFSTPGQINLPESSIDADMLAVLQQRTGFPHRHHGGDAHFARGDRAVG